MYKGLRHYATGGSKLSERLAKARLSEKLAFASFAPPGDSAALAVAVLAIDAPDLEFKLSININYS